ncbi:MAG TPA: alpha/beta hydrolase [Alphaproteobacteria bacterium]|nr:alpha/beta hydrolase [Alphaproteobacteria bacterium]
MELAYAEQGDPSGVPLVLLHGYTDSWRSFEPLLHALPKWIRAVAVSQRGHGDSHKPRSRYDTSLFAADLAEFMERIKIRRAVVAGHSMGSLVAQRFALDQPQRTLGLVLLGAFKTLKGNAAATALWHDAVATLEDPVNSRLVREFQQSTLARPVPSDFFETIVAESLRVPAHVWRSAFRSLLREDMGSEVGKISAPTLILWGDRDGFCSLQEQEALAAAIPDASLIAYAGAGHSPHWEEPDKAAADISAFAGSVAAPTARARLIA